VGKVLFTVLTALCTAVVGAVFLVVRLGWSEVNTEGHAMLVLVLLVLLLLWAALIFFLVGALLLERQLRKTEVKLEKHRAHVDA
jgi:uncharacterized membrane protein